MLRVRRAGADDAPAIHAAHTAAIRGGCATHYAPEEIEVWARRPTPESYLEDVVRRDVFIADEAGRVVGFGVLDAADAEVRALYVEPGAAGRGVGTQLLGVLETTARLRGRTALHLDASLNAVPFYLAAGWTRARGTTHTLAPGRDIACVVMTKTLDPAVLHLRDQRPHDADAVRALTAAAFARDAEAALVDRLRAAGALACSLVAVLDGEVLGHVAFSPVAVEGVAGVLGLGPMAVRPEYQGDGIGSRLVEEGLARLRERGCPAVVVLGHLDFYPRFGFVPASRFRLRYGAGPDDAFMAAELVAGALARASGAVRYRPEFATL